MESHSQLKRPRRSFCHRPGEASRRFVHKSMNPRVAPTFGRTDTTSSTAHPRPNVGAGRAIRGKLSQLVSKYPLQPNANAGAYFLLIISFQHLSSYGWHRRSAAISLAEFPILITAAAIVTRHKSFAVLFLSSYSSWRLFFDCLPTSTFQHLRQDGLSSIPRSLRMPKIFVRPNSIPYQLLQLFDVRK